MDKFSEEQISKLNEIKQKLIWGLENKKVFPYSADLFDHLRPFCVAGVPASIMLFVTDFCNGYCYDRSMLMQLAFNDCKVVHANIESLRISDGEELSEHSFVETPEFGNGKTWVVDTSTSLIYDKDFYYELEKPKINRVFSKKQCLKNPEILSILASNFENEKYCLPIILPIIEKIINNSNYLGTCLYREKLLSEIDKFKDAINYEMIDQEVKDDMILMKTAPEKLDEKFKIVRDKYGNEVSRNGIQNPYYTPLGEYLQIQNDPQKYEQYIKKLHKKTVSEHKKEDKRIEDLAKKRLKEILINPTTNFYENQPE